MQLNKSDAKKIFSVVLSLVLSLLCTVNIAMLTVKTTVASSAYMKNKVQASNFSQIAKTELEEKYTSYGSASGFTIGAFADILDDKKIEEDICKNIDKIYIPDTAVVSYDTVKQNVNNMLISDVQSRNISITPDIKTGVTALAGICAQDYIDTVSLPFVSYITVIINAIQSKLNFISIVFLVACIFTALFILAINRKSHRIFRYYAYSFGATFLLTAIVPCIMLFTDKMAYISVRPISLNRFTVEYLNGIFRVMLNYSLVCLFIYVACVVAYYIFRRKNSKSAKKAQNAKNNNIVKHDAY
ncbi:MAG: hypothetical protein RR846_07350 [Oscillospiraceae bacterium]